MTQSKINIGILYGGTSPERMISIKTGFMIAKSLNLDKYEIVPIEISKEGRYIFRELDEISENTYSNSNYNLYNLEDYRMVIKTNIKQLVNSNIDLIFIALHGINGEDGTIQGLLESLKIPYTGSAVSASAIAINKDITKQLYLYNNIDTPKWCKFNRNIGLDFNSIIGTLNFPLIIKPCYGGSSLDIKVVNDTKQLKEVLPTLSSESNEYIIEEYIKGIEVTCGVIEKNGNPEALPPIEIDVKAPYFDYNSKYGTSEIEQFIPARLEEDMMQEIKDISVKIHQLLGCKDISSTDFIIAPGNNIYTIETNTIPGLTKTSLVPKAARNMGIDFSKLLDIIIENALFRYSNHQVK